MKLQLLVALAYALSFTTALPSTEQVDKEISVRDNTPLTSTNTLAKRKGGGGGKSGGGSSSGGKTGSGSSSGSGRSYSSTSNVGGSTRDGSGTPRSYGNKYTGGATVPYTSGGRSPSRSVAPYLLGAGAFAFFPGIWLYSVYAYPYPIGYHWYGNGRNMTSNVTCLCEQYSECGCDPDDNSTFLAQVVTNNGSSANGAPVNTSMVQTVDYNNGTIATYINGTLDNGTTAPGGTDPSNDSESSAVKLALEYSGYWVMVATVVSGVMMV